MVRLKLAVLFSCSLLSAISALGFEQDSPAQTVAQRSSLHVQGWFVHCEIDKHWRGWIGPFAEPEEAEVLRRWLLTADGVSKVSERPRWFEGWDEELKDGFLVVEGDAIAQGCVPVRRILVGNKRDFPRLFLLVKQGTKREILRADLPVPDGYIVTREVVQFVDDDKSVHRAIEIKQPDDVDFALPGSPLPAGYVILDELPDEESRCARSVGQASTGRWRIAQAQEHATVIAGTAIPDRYVVVARQEGNRPDTAFDYWHIRRIGEHDEMLTVLAGTPIPPGYVAIEATCPEGDGTHEFEWQIRRVTSDPTSGRSPLMLAHTPKPERFDVGGAEPAGEVCRLALQGTQWVSGLSLDARGPEAIAAAPVLSHRNRLQVYAGPNVFGPWATVASHGGPMEFTIRVAPIGSTSVTGEVKYVAEDKRETTRGFLQQTRIRTGDVWANVQVRLRGTPTGSSCWVYVSGSALPR